MRCLFALMSYVSILSLSIVIFVCFYVNNEERLALGRHHVKKFLECCLFPKYLPKVLVTNDVVIDEYHVSLLVVFKVSNFNYYSFKIQFSRQKEVQIAFVLLSTIYPVYVGTSEILL